MAYASPEYYRDEFHGSMLPENEAARYLELASDELDHVTHDRIATACPEDPRHMEKIRRAACVVAEALYNVEIQRRAASAQQQSDGSLRGAVASISSGRESISYAQPSAAASVYAAAAASEPAQQALIISIAAKYLANVPDANGTNLLYAGAEGMRYV